MAPTPASPALPKGFERVRPRKTAASPRSTTAAAGLALGLALLAAVAACAPETRVTRLHTPPHPLTPLRLDDVDVFTVQPPQRPFVEVALITSWVGLWGVYSEAAKLGCDAVFLRTPVDERGAGYGHFAQATCLVYQDPGRASSPAAPLAPASGASARQPPPPAPAPSVSPLPSASSSECFNAPDCDEDDDDCTPQPCVPY